MFDINAITRQNVRDMKAYSSARAEFKGKADIWLDANENPNETTLNRYPDPLQLNLKSKISELKNVAINQIFIGNGSDEAIDLLFRAFLSRRRVKQLFFLPLMECMKFRLRLTILKWSKFLCQKILLYPNWKVSKMSLILKVYFSFARPTTRQETKQIWLELRKLQLILKD